MNENNSDIENDIHLGNENEQIKNPNEFFKVTPDDYTDSDSNTIIDFDEEEDSKNQNQEHGKNVQNQNQDIDNREEMHSDVEKKMESNSKKNENEEVGLPSGEENHVVEGIAPNTNPEEQEEEQENQEEKEEEDNGITDPNVKQLMKMDIADKEGIINLLMKDNLVKKSEVKIEKVIKEKNKSKFDHVESHIGKEQIGNRKSTYGRKGFQIEQEEGNPEFIKDINIAANAVKDQLEKENQDVAKILFNEKSTKKTVKRITREQIDEKVKKTLERKKKNLEKIEAQMYEKQKTNETFTPVINHRKGDTFERRNLNKFLRDQKNFTKKVEKKKEEMINQKKEKIDKINMGKPQVDKNSEELAKKLNNTEEPAYLRLYNKRTLEKEKNEEKEKLRKERKKEEEQKRKEKMQENNKQYAHIQSKINMGQKKEEKIVDKFGNVEKTKKENIVEKEREMLKEKYIQKKMKKNKAKLLEIKEIPTKCYTKISLKNMKNQLNLLKVII